VSQIKEFLCKQFPESYAHHLEELLSEFNKSGLASPHLASEVQSGDDGKLWARVWEAMLYRHLLGLGFKPCTTYMKKSGERGPDFRIVYQEQIIWIEAVTPAPEGIPPDYLEPPKKGQVAFKSIPYDERLLRWTSVLRDKRAKLESDKKRGIIADNDCTIIAVNSCRLQDWAPNDLGISRLPFAVEAVFPIGPLAFPITIDGQRDGEPANVPRYEIPKNNNSLVPTTNFLNPDYTNVSALLGSYHKPMMNPDYQKTGRISLTLVHNPLAAIPLPRGILGVENEYFAEEQGGHYILRLFGASD
jgi:hypothetical protein